MHVIWYDCPKCGKPESAPDMGFCGTCEQEYQEFEAERARYEEERRIEYNRKHPEW